MTEFAYRRNSCRLCDGYQLELVMQLAPTPPADTYATEDQLDKGQEIYPLDLFFCQACNHLQLLDVVDPKILFVENYLYVTTSSLGSIDHFRRYADVIMGKVNFPEGSLVVDIGSNDGMLLKFFKERGMRVLGVDPAEELAKKATDCGMETLSSFFTSELATKINRDYGRAAIVTANNVFAHADNLADMAEGIRGMLAPDGIFVFEVAYMVDIVQGMLFDTIYHEHLCYHTVKPLERFFRHHGMELIDIERIPAKGGSLRGIVQLSGGPYTMSTSVDELIALETEYDFDRTETFKAFAARIDDVKAQLLNMLCNLKSQGKTIAGYGASANVTTLVYHFELRDLLAFIVDDNPERQNLFSPGYNIPILSPEVIYERKIDYVIILAWTYSEPIMRKHQAFLNQGGHFILPLPEVSIV